MAGGSKCVKTERRRLTRAPAKSVVFLITVELNYHDQSQAAIKVGACGVAERLLGRLCVGMRPSGLPTKPSLMSSSKSGACSHGEDSSSHPQ